MAHSYSPTTDSLVREKASRASNDSNPLQITDGEVNYLWSFIQGSIMYPEVWTRLMRSWGFCERHAWVTLSVDMAFRRRYLLGPAILYGSLTRNGFKALRPTTIGQRRAVISRLKARGQCLVCDANIRDGGALRRGRLEEGKRSANLRSFAIKLAPIWWSYVCPTCVPSSGGHFLCRQHLAQNLADGISADIAEQHAALGTLAERVAVYRDSFIWENRGIDTAEDRASLLAAIGWCSGWTPLMTLAGRATSVSGRGENLCGA